MWLKDFLGKRQKQKKKRVDLNQWQKQEQMQMQMHTHEHETDEQDAPGRPIQSCWSSCERIISTCFSMWHLRTAPPCEMLN